MTGNVLINSNANRLSQYYVWSYAPDNESYYKFLYIDFAASQDKVYSHMHYFAFAGGLRRGLSGYCVHMHPES